MNLKFAGNVAAMCDDRVDRNEKMIGDLFVRHPLYKCHHNILFPVGKLFAYVTLSREHHCGYILCNAVLAQALFEFADGRNKDIVLYRGMQIEPFLIIIYTIEGGCEFVVALRVTRQILQYDVLECFA